MTTPNSAGVIPPLGIDVRIDRPWDRESIIDSPRFREVQERLMKLLSADDLELVDTGR